MHMPYLSPTYSQRGGIFLSLAVVIFLLSLLAAAAMLFILWQDAGRSTTALLALVRGETAAPSPTPSTLDPLVPSLLLADELINDRADLEKQLWMPLRAYYATRAERLGNITVAPADTPKHTTRVTIQLSTPEDSTEHSFYYDRSGKNRDGSYPKWEPGMLDDTK